MLYNRNSFINETGICQGHVQKGLQECTSTIVVFPDPLSSLPATTSSMKTPKTQTRTFMTLNWQINKIFK
jgi:hypothetical protein